MSRQFARKVEDFFRARCRAAVAGDGDMNRCPRCLGSLRVDVDPGDRAADCGGPLRTVRVERKGDRCNARLQRRPLDQLQPGLRRRGRGRRRQPQRHRADEARRRHAVGHLSRTQDLPDPRPLEDGRDDLHFSAAAVRTPLHVDVEHALQQPPPADAVRQGLGRLGLAPSVPSRSSPSALPATAATPPWGSRTPTARTAGCRSPHPTATVANSAASTVDTFGRSQCESPAPRHGSRSPGRAAARARRASSIRPGTSVSKGAKDGLSQAGLLKFRPSSPPDKAPAPASPG